MTLNQELMSFRLSDVIKQERIINMNIKKSVCRIVAFIMIPLLFLSGCSIIDKITEGFPGGRETDGESGVTSKAGNNSNDGEADPDVVITDNPPEYMELPGRSIGKATFRKAADKTATVKYSASGKEQSLSVTDDSGIEWTLEIPGNALINEEEISITPIIDIELDSYPGMKPYGILLEPDKLDFIKFASVIVKKSGESIDGIILTGDHNGSELVLSPVKAYDNGVIAPVRHFSTIFFVPGDDQAIPEIKEEAKEQYDKAVEAAKELLKRPITVPAPPSIDLECLDERKIRQAREYAELVIKEEEDILVRMAALDANYLFASLNDRNSIGRQLEARKRAKMNKLIKQYGLEPEKFLAVYHAALKVAETYNLNTDSVEEIIDLIILLPCAENDSVK